MEIIHDPELYILEKVADLILTELGNNFLFADQFSEFLLLSSQNNFGLRVHKNIFSLLINNLEIILENLLSVPPSHSNWNLIAAKSSMSTFFIQRKNKTKACHFR